MCTLADDARQPSGGAGIYFWDGDWEEEDSLADAGEVKQGVVEAMILPTGKRLEDVRSRSIIANTGLNLLVASFNTHDLRWSPDGNALSIIDKNQFCILHDLEATPETTPIASPELSLIQE